MVKAWYLFCAGFLLAWAAGTWGYVFWLMLRTGKVLLIEPWRLVQVTEFAAAVCLTLCGIAVGTYGFIKIRR